MASNEERAREIAEKCDRARDIVMSDLDEVILGSVDPSEPGGLLWQANLALHGGREFTGGETCWDPRVSCEGICRVCPREQGGAP